MVWARRTPFVVAAAMSDQPAYDEMSDGSIDSCPFVDEEERAKDDEDYWRRDAAKGATGLNPGQRPNRADPRPPGRCGR